MDRSTAMSRLAQCRDQLSVEIAVETEQDESVMLWSNGMLGVMVADVDAVCWRA